MSANEYNVSNFLLQHNEVFFRVSSNMGMLGFHPGFMQNYSEKALTIEDYQKRMIKFICEPFQ